MRAKFVNEFERGLDPRHALGVGRVTIIQKWFRNLGIPEYDYIIEPDRVILNGNLDLNLAKINIENIDWGLPDGLKIIGYLDLINTKITKLPDDLEVTDSLYLRNSLVAELPRGLIIGQDLWLNNSLITELPDDLEVKYSILVSPDQKELIAFIENSEFADKLKFWK